MGGAGGDEGAMKGRASLLRVVEQKRLATLVEASLDVEYGGGEGRGMLDAEHGEPRCWHWARLDRVPAPGAPRRLRVAWYVSTWGAGASDSLPGWCVRATLAIGIA